MLLTNPESGADVAPHPAEIRAAGNPDTKDALAPVRVEICWRAPSIVSTHLGCLMGCPQLAAAPQAASAICLSSGCTTLSLLLHTWVWGCFTPPG